MKRTANWCRHNGGYYVHVPGWGLDLRLWFSSAEQLKAFAVANNVILREVKK